MLLGRFNQYEIQMNIPDKINELIDTENELVLLQKKNEWIKSIADSMVIMNGIGESMIDCKSYARKREGTDIVECRTIVRINGKELFVDSEISEYEFNTGLLSPRTVTKIKCDIALKIANVIFGDITSAMQHELNVKKQMEYYFKNTAKPLT